MTFDYRITDPSIENHCTDDQTRKDTYELHTSLLSHFVCSVTHLVRSRSRVDVNLLVRTDTGRWRRSDYSNQTSFQISLRYSMSSTMSRSVLQDRSSSKMLRSSVLRRTAWFRDCDSDDYSRWTVTGNCRRRNVYPDRYASRSWKESLDSQRILNTRRHPEFETK